MDNMLHDSKTNFNTYLKNRPKAKFTFRQVNIGDITKIISKLKPKPNAGPEYISSKLLKACSQQLCPLLVYLINLSLKQGVFPKQLKVAKVIPIFKSEDSHLFNNYRPISLLPSFSKVYEKVVASQIVQYLDDNKLYYQDQYGFRKGYSTIHPLIRFFNFISEAHSNNKHAMAVFIDLKKAFDTVNHQILLSKLKFME